MNAHQRRRVIRQAERLVGRTVAVRSTVKIGGPGAPTWHGQVEAVERWPAPWLWVRRLADAGGAYVPTLWSLKEIRGVLQTSAAPETCANSCANSVRIERQ